MRFTYRGRVIREGTARPDSRADPVSVGGSEVGNASRLPALAEGDGRWQEEAACHGLGARLFFRPAGDRDRDPGRRDAAAREVCALCPVQRDCLRHALKAPEPSGIWGGLTGRERRGLRAAEEPWPGRRSAARGTTPGE
ncbi:WhiB family transcriptional regulator [Streptomyces sp. NPDC054961]